MVGTALLIKSAIDATPVRFNAIDLRTIFSSICCVREFRITILDYMRSAPYGLLYIFAHLQDYQQIVDYGALPWDYRRILQIFEFS